MLLIFLLRHFCCHWRDAPIAEHIIIIMVPIRFFPYLYIDASFMIVNGLNLNKKSIISLYDACKNEYIIF